jgi:hypothetical protein
MGKRAGIAESLIETHEMLAFITLSLFGMLFPGCLFWGNQFSQNALTIYFFVAAIGLAPSVLQAIRGAIWSMSMGQEST